MSEPQKGRITRRAVFYIPGFDPFPARRYRELCRTEGKAQAKISGYRLSQKADGPGWRVVYTHSVDTSVDTQFRVLSWSDVVKEDMQGSALTLFFKLLLTMWIYGRSRAYSQLWSLRKGPVLAIAYPVFGFLLQLILMMSISVWAILVAMSYVGIWGLLFVLIAWPIWWGFRRLDRKLFIHYLLYDFAAAAAHDGALSPQMEQRVEAFRADIQAALDTDFDEVLIVGHSSGAHIGALTLAPLAQNETGRLSFLTLGQVFPMLGLLRGASELRHAARRLGQSDIPWVDVSSIADGCSFALCHPVTTITKSETSKWPLVISAAFAKSVKSARLKSMRRRFFRIHFQYLCHFDDPKYFDYFETTCGPNPLQKTFEGRRSSPSLISQPRRGVRYD